MRRRRLRTERGDVGYLRIFSFNVSGVRSFLDAAGRLISGLPGRALIVDIRANPGGLIPAAEALLQLLTERRVRPADFSMATTPQVLSLCRENPALRIWADSVRDSVETGEAFSQAFPLSDPEALAEDRPRYPGKVVLVTDALCYSAADIFAAGFQDNEIGRVLGIDGHTGAGGANVWTHDLLRFWLPDLLDPLPGGASFRIALRRATRTGPRTTGTPLEDYGVTPDRIHRQTLRDLTSENEDLTAAAARLALARPRRR
jgi:C-terminal processing protease CtpA/Prc